MHVGVPSREDWTFLFIIECLPFLGDSKALEAKSIHSERYLPCRAIHTLYETRCDHSRFDQP